MTKQIYEVVIVKQTEKAYLVKAGGKEQWLPKSTTTLTVTEGNKAEWEIEAWKYDSKFGPNAEVKPTNTNYSPRTTAPTVTSSTTTGVMAVKQLLQEALNRLNLIN